MDSTYRRQRHNSEEVCSVKWDFIKMSQQEEDLILRMYRLVGDRNVLIYSYAYDRLKTNKNVLVVLRVTFCITFAFWWEIIAGRVPGRKAVEIERYWIMRNNAYFLPPSCKS